VRPKLVVCNGPGVCIPICLSAKLLLRDVRIVFVESFCRTQSLSLSGRILYFCRICDHFLVQWPQLTHRYNRAKYIGLLNCFWMFELEVWTSTHRITNCFWMFELEVWTSTHRI
ncbi:unnamed protein product, partial [Medioppia subpectinata]